MLSQTPISLSREKHLPKYENLYSKKVRQILSEGLAETDIKHLSKYLGPTFLDFYKSPEKTLYRPKHRIEIEQYELFFTDRLYSFVDDYYCVIGYVFIPEISSYEPRIFYTPNPGGKWRVSPYINNRSFENGESIGLDPEVGTLVAPYLQEAFSKTSLCVTKDSIFYTLGTLGIRKFLPELDGNETKKISTLGWNERQAFDANRKMYFSHYYIEMLKGCQSLQPIPYYDFHLGSKKGSPSFDLSTYFQKHPLPKEVTNNLSKTNVWGYFEHPILGKYITEYFESLYRKHRIKIGFSYTQGEPNKAWISELEITDVPYNTYGIRSMQFTGGLITTPPMEYNTRLPLTMLDQVQGIGDFRCVDIRHHLQSNPLIQSCKALKHYAG